MLSAFSAGMLSAVNIPTRFVISLGALLWASACTGTPADSSSDDATDAGASDSESTAPDADTGGTDAEETGHEDESTEASDSDTGESSDEGDTSEVETNGDDSGSGDDCSDKACSSDEYCDWQQDACGRREWESGHCEPRPNGCDDEYAPVCACDGEVYSNRCRAAAAGVDVDTEGECTPPEGMFQCGAGFCDPQSQYCEVLVSDTDEPSQWQCRTQPDECGDSPGCDCLAEVRCGELCEVTGDGFAVICPGG